MMQDSKIRKYRGGQVFIEMMILLIFVMIPLVYVTLEAGQYASLKVRMSSAAREAGRITIANNILPPDGVNISAQDTRVRFETEVYNLIQQMVRPSDFDDNQGVVYISILRRTDDGQSTDPNQTQVTVENVFDYGNLSFSAFTNGNGTGLLPMARYNEGDTFTGASADKLIDPLTLDVNERTVLIELFHPLTFSDAVRGMLGNTTWNYVYDYSVF